ncbi:MAG TPA: hypothetical protein VNJ53_10835 [Gaiellaceae bacterium]|nr:hypothetical protein [Gaiellaceae bacterium]
MHVRTATLAMALVLLVLAAALWWFSVGTNGGCYPWQDPVRAEPPLTTTIRATICR